MIECSICKSRNQDESIYCSECGQRLHHPTVNSALKLHSPLLDDRANREYFSTPADKTSGDLPHSQGTASPGAPIHNGLHSPLLDAWETRPLPAPQPDLGSSNNKPSRLHSPVLDGPGHSPVFEPEDLDMPVEEYNSLRSPLLAAKVPMPESVKPPAEPVPPINPVSNLQPTIQSLLGASVEPQKSPSEEGFKQFASSLYDQSPVETGDRPAVRSPRQTGHFTKITGLKKEDKTDNSSGTAQALEKAKSISGRTLLPKQEESSVEQVPVTDTPKPGFFKILAVFLLLASIVFKGWYWQTLGAALGSSPSFLFDQIGEIMVILLLLILILTAKF